MLIPSRRFNASISRPSLSRRVNANSQLAYDVEYPLSKLIKKGEC